MSPDINTLEAKVTIDTTELDAELGRIEERVGGLDSAVKDLNDRLADVGGGGSASPDAVREVLQEEWGEDFDEALARILLPSRKVGPSPAGAYHEASMWGVHFKTARKAHLGSSVVDAGESGTFTAQLGHYNGKKKFDTVATRDIEVDQGINEIYLDFDVPSNGSYLLTRNGNFPLRRRMWDGWDSQSREGVELIGGSKPGDWQKPNPFWYYFFELEIASSKDAH